MAKKSSATVTKAAAIAHLFDANSDSDCADIRDSVDSVLSSASDGAILPTTSNDALLSLFIIPDKIQFLHIRLNQALAWHKPFTPFLSGELKTTSSVGEIREGGYTHCGAQCSHT
ncbi:MAG TPA: hypothetical protein VIP05_19565 [Burkholderiaceae bacterium]